MCMAKPAQVWMQSGTGEDSRVTIVVPHDILVDNLKVEDYKQMEFDARELEVLSSGQPRQSTKAESAKVNVQTWNADALDEKEALRTIYDEKKCSGLPLPVTMSRGESTRAQRKKRNAVMTLVKLAIVLFVLYRVISSDGSIEEMVREKEQDQRVDHLDEIYNLFNGVL